MLHVKFPRNHHQGIHKKKPLKTHQFPKLTQNKFVVLLMVATLQIQEFETQGSGV